MQPKQLDKGNYKVKRKGKLFTQKVQLKEMRGLYKETAVNSMAAKYTGWDPEATSCGMVHNGK